MRSQNKVSTLTDRQKEKMEAEITEMLEASRNRGPADDMNKTDSSMRKAQMQDLLKAQYGNNNYAASSQSAMDASPDAPVDSTIRSHPVHNQQHGFRSGESTYHAGQFVGADHRRCQKLLSDPVMELKHIIGYTPSKCSSLKWSQLDGENVLIFSANSTLIAMDVESGVQKRFFFGHTKAIKCFDISQSGGLIASA